MLVAIAVTAVASLASVAASAPSQGGVTMRMERFLEPGTNFVRVRFSGVVSSGRAGESVTVMEQRCGATFSTAMAGATTGPGGFWEATPSTYYQHATLMPGTFRARWRGEVSEPVAFRPPIHVTVRRQRSGRFLAFLSGHATTRGEFLELQRLVGGQWKRFKYLRLGTAGSKYGDFAASFAVGARGWILRVYAPPETAAPCYTASATKTFRS